MAGALSTDFYEITMAAGYWRAGLRGSATFELFARQLPRHRAFLVAAGLDPALAWLERLAFDDSERRWLRGLPQLARVPAEFFDDYLTRLRFTGEVWAIPEGTPVFPGEPILRITAPLPEAQLVETALLSIVAFQTSVAAKAARMVHTAAGRPVVEFGARRAHGLDAALGAARAAYIGGCQGTSYVEAARVLGIPTSGTMAHSWVQTFPSEVDAFREFSRTFPDTAVYLLDTYDTVAAARALVVSGLRPQMVRLDSGDLVALSLEVRRILDDAGWRDTRIFATGDLDEYRIASLVAAGAPIDGFGVGTALSTVSDAPALPAVYKLVEVERHGAPVGVVKLSPGKQTWPGPKQVWRKLEGGAAAGDVVAATGEPGPEGARPLLECVMRGGRRLAAPESIHALKRRCLEQVAALPAALRDLDATAVYPVAISQRLERARRQAEPRGAEDGKTAKVE